MAGNNTEYINAHGTRYGLKINGQWLDAEDLREWLCNFDPGVHIVLIIDGCHSGSFINISDKTDLVMTACGAYECFPRLGIPHEAKGSGGAKMFRNIAILSLNTTLFVQLVFPCLVAAQDVILDLRDATDEKH